jgi:hypothetical protein
MLMQVLNTCVYAGLLALGGFFASRGMSLVEIFLENSIATKPKMLTTKCMGSYPLK